MNMVFEVFLLQLIVVYIWQRLHKSRNGSWILVLKSEDQSTPRLHDTLETQAERRARELHALSKNILIIVFILLAR